jgi:hypothetical protein
MNARSADLWLWIGFGAAIVVGGLLYLLRCGRYHVWYGVAEIVVAVLLIYLFFFPEGPNRRLINEWTGVLGPVWGALLSRGVTLFAGLYIFRAYGRVRPPNICAAKWRFRPEDGNDGAGRPNGAGRPRAARQ